MADDLIFKTGIEGTEDVTKAADKMAKAVTGSFDKMDKGAATAGKTFSAVTDGLNKVAEQAVKFGETGTKAASAFKAFGEATGVAAQSFTNLSSAFGATKTAVATMAFEVTTLGKAFTTLKAESAAAWATFKAAEGLPGKIGAVTMAVTALGRAVGAAVTFISNAAAALGGLYLAYIAVIQPLTALIKKHLELKESITDVQALYAAWVKFVDWWKGVPWEETQKKLRALGLTDETKQIEELTKKLEELQKQRDALAKGGAVAKTPGGIRRVGDDPASFPAVVVNPFVVGDQRAAALKKLDQEIAETKRQLEELQNAGKKADEAIKKTAGTTLTGMASGWENIKRELTAIRDLSNEIDQTWAGLLRKLRLDYFVPKEPTTATPGKAAGGMLHGPGTTTSDSLLIRASQGEYVVNADAVSHYGVGTLEAINARRFQDGGQVELPQVNVSYRTPSRSTPSTAATSGEAGGILADYLRRRGLELQAEVEPKKQAWVGYWRAVIKALKDGNRLENWKLADIPTLQGKIVGVEDNVVAVSDKAWPVDWPLRNLGYSWPYSAAAAGHSGIGGYVKTDPETGQTLVGFSGGSWGGSFLKPLDRFYAENFASGGLVGSTAATSGEAGGILADYLRRRGLELQAEVEPKKQAWIGYWRAVIKALQDGNRLENWKLADIPTLQGKIVGVEDNVVAVSDKAWPVDWPLRNLGYSWPYSAAAAGHSGIGGYVKTDPETGQTIVGFRGGPSGKSFEKPLDRFYAENFAGGGLVGALGKSFASGGFAGGSGALGRGFQTGGFAGSGLSSLATNVGGGARGLHPVTIALPSGQTVNGFHAEPSAIAQMSREASVRRMASAGRRSSAEG